MNTRNFTIEKDIEGDSENDTHLLKQMASNVRSYLDNFSWCPSIKNNYLAFGIGGVIGLFLVEFNDTIGGSDSFLWVIVGDCPSAYLVCDEIDPKKVLEIYIGLMKDWMEAVESGSSLDDVFPVSAEATTANAADLSRRLNYIEKNIIPSISGDVES